MTTINEKLRERFEERFKGLKLANYFGLLENFISEEINRAVEGYKQNLRNYGYGDGIARYETEMAQNQETLKKIPLLYPQGGDKQN